MHVLVEIYHFGGTAQVVTEVLCSIAATTGRHLAGLHDERAATNCNDCSRPGIVIKIVLQDAEVEVRGLIRYRADDQTVQ